MSDSGKKRGNGIARDVTWRKEMEKALRQSEQRYSALMNNIGLGIAWTSKDFDIIIANKALAGMFRKHSEANLAGRKCYCVFEKRDARCPHCPGIRAMQQKRQAAARTTGTRDDGGSFSANITTYPTFGQSGEVSGFIEIVEDITDREKTRDALLQSEERFAKIFQAIPVPTIITGSDSGRILDVNESMLALIGYHRDELLGRTALELNVWVDPEERSVLGDKFRRDNRLREEPIRCRTKSGAIRDILLSAELIRSGDRNAILSLFYDVTDKKIRAEEEKTSLSQQLQQAHKMEVVGTLAGGIAHDFNNILASIIGFTEMTLQKDSQADNDVKASLEQILNAANRAKDLVQQILAFSRRQTETRKPILMIPAVKETLGLLRDSIPSTIEFRTFFSARRNTVLAEPVHIQQILMNLCSNAAHAMGENGGVLEIGLSNADLDEDAASEKEVKPGKYLQLSVRDTGCGIDPEFLDRIFDPFFTTKSHSEGTGLGLSVIYGIVKSAGGGITAASKPGEGTVFDVYLPLFRGSDAGVRPERPSQKGFPGGKESILYVDDEESLALLGKEMLSQIGYNVTPCVRSTEALSIFQRVPQCFDLIITDYTMPFMNGAELSRKMLEIRSDIPIILSTGFSPSITREKIQQTGIREFITKPISIRDLALIIRKVLDENR